MHAGFLSQIIGAIVPPPESAGLESCVFKWEHPQYTSTQFFSYWQSNSDFYQNDLFILVSDNQRQLLSLQALKH